MVTFHVISEPGKEVYAILGCNGKKIVSGWWRTTCPKEAERAARAIYAKEIKEEESK